MVVKIIMSLDFMTITKIKDFFFTEFWPFHTKDNNYDNKDIIIKIILKT